MKNKNLFSSLCAILMMVALCLLSSCESAINEEEPDTVTETGNGNLTVHVHQIASTPFASLTRDAKPVSEVCTRLNYAVYTLDNQLVKQVNQSSKDSNYGNASFQLDAGDYLLVVVGHSAEGNPTMSDPTCIKFTNILGFTDTFLCCGTVTIGTDPVDMRISMDRIVSLCRFVITDDIPADVKSMQFYYTGGSGAFDATTALGCVDSKQTVKVDVVNDQKQFDLYTFLHDTEGTIHLKVSALDANGSELTIKEFDIPLQQNYITWFSGPFFTGTTTGNANLSSITVNTDWAGEKHLTF